MYKLYILKKGGQFRTTTYIVNSIPTLQHLDFQNRALISQMRACVRIVYGVYYSVCEFGIVVDRTVCVCHHREIETYALVVLSSCQRWAAF